MSDTDSSTVGPNGANMSTDDETARVAVRTYVPAYQRDDWRKRAETAGMSTSEFVRSMVQAGVRDFDLGDQPAMPAEPDVSAPDPGGNGLEDQVLEVLRSEDLCTWEDLVSAVTADVEDRLESALQELQAANRVSHSPREGGYRVIEDE